MTALNTSFFFSGSKKEDILSFSIPKFCALFLQNGTGDNCLKCVRIRISFSPNAGKYQPRTHCNFKKIAKRYAVDEVGKIQTRKTPNTDTFYGVNSLSGRNNVSEMWTSCC